MLDSKLVRFKVRPSKKSPEGPQKDPVSKGRLVKQLSHTQAFQAGSMIVIVLMITVKAPTSMMIVDFDGAACITLL